MGSRRTGTWPRSCTRRAPRKGGARASWRWAAPTFGIGVPQDRRQAVAWFAKAGAQGLGQGEYSARWLRDPLNNIGFRTQAEHDLVVGGKLRFGLLSGDPTGITFHSSAQRTAWLTAQRREVDLTEAHTMWRIRADEYSQCQRAGGSSGINRGSDPARR